MIARGFAGLCWGILLAALTSCQQGGRIVYITATPPSAVSASITVPRNSVPTIAAMQTDAPFIPATAATAQPANDTTAAQHIVQPGETLSSIAALYETSVETLLRYNTVTDPNIIAVGQVIDLPPPPDAVTPARMILPDGLLVRGPAQRSFDLDAFIQEQRGYLTQALDDVDARQANGSTRTDVLSGPEIVARVALEFSVDPRLLLALLEYRSGWLTQPTVSDVDFPLISAEDSAGIDRSGLYKQLAWAANELNRGFYAYSYGDLRILEFDSGVRMSFSQQINAATAAVQRFLSLNTHHEDWERDVAATGFSAAYTALFGDPWEQDVPASLSAFPPQPPLTLPFQPGETWFFTGGMHGGWGSGSAWAAVDFAPPDERTDLLCYTSAYWVRAIADGVIARSGGGVVVLDLDGDGDESTGWTVLYLHLASADRIASGVPVQMGTPLGRAACEGGFSTATHLHIARRYNGAWVPGDCFDCDDSFPDFVMSGWRVVGLRGQVYQGYIDRAGERRVAEQGRLSPDNRIAW